MLDRKKTIMIISFIYWGLILGNTIYLIVNDLGEIFPTMSQLSTLTLGQLISFLGMVLFIFFFFLFLSMFKYFYLTIIYFGCVISIRKFYKEKLDITDKKTDNYYRDLLAKNSVGVLGYIKDFNVDEKDLVATIMSLELKGKICIEDNIIIKNSSVGGLDSNEIYILENLISNNGKNIDFFVYKNKVIDDCINHGLLIEKGDFKKKRNIKIIRYCVLMLLFVLCFIFMPTFFNNYISGKAEWLVNLFLILTFGSFFMLVLAPFVFGARLMIYASMSKVDPYVRSKQARDINSKLSGLENFLKDFSIIHERSRKELKIWEDYLIYSVIFNQNDDIKDEIIAKLK